MEVSAVPVRKCVWRREALYGKTYLKVLLLPLPE